MKINNKVLNIIIVSIYIMTLLLGNNIFLGFIEINENIINYGIVIVPIVIVMIILILNIKNIKELFNNKLNIILSIIFLLWCLLTIFKGINIGMQNAKAFIHFGIVFSLIILFSQIKFTNEQIKIIKKHLFISFGITLIYGIIEYIFNFNLDLYSNGKYPGMKGRIYSTFYIATLYDKYIAVMSAFICYELQKELTNKREIISLWVLLFLSGIGVALTFSRTGLLLYIANIVLFALTLCIKRNGKQVIPIVFIIVCMFFLPGVRYSFQSALDMVYSVTKLDKKFQIDIVNDNKIIKNGENLENNGKDLNDKHDSSLEHRDYYKKVGKTLLEENKIHGIGLGNYSYLYNNQNAKEYLKNKDVVKYKYMYPHSSYVQLGAETGYTGIILFYIAIIGFLITSMINNNKVKKIFLVYIFIQLLAISYVEGILYAKQYIYLFMIIFGLYLNNETDKKKLKTNKISFLLLHLGYGGIESSTINTANSLCDKYDIEIMSFYKLDKNQANKLNDKIQIKYLYNGEPNKEEFINAIHKHKFIKALKEGIKASDILLKKKIKVIRHIINNDAKYIISTRWEFSILLSRYGNNYSTKIAQEHHYHNNNQKYINILKYKYNNIDYLFALTKTLEKDYKNFLEGNNDHTKVVLMPNMLYEIPSKESKLNDKNIITVSRLDEGKKNDDIIRTFSKLKEKDWKLYIIGDGKEYHNLNSLIEELELKDKVILTGYKNKEEIEKYMLESSLFLMASISEGLPMVLLEAMSYGLPCIAYHTDSGTDDIIKDNKNGYIINNRNEKEYINKIEKVIKDDKLRIKLGKEAKNTACEFSKEKITEKWLEILNK